MLGECGIISREDSDEIIKGLEGILSDIDSGRLEMDMTAEDIHMFIEAELTKRLGDVEKTSYFPFKKRSGCVGYPFISER